MATVIGTEKLPGENVAQAVDFTPVLGTAETVTFGEVTIIEEDGDAAPAGMVTTVGVSSDRVTFTLAGGVSNTRYILDVLATLNVGDKIGQRLLLTVL